MYKDVILSDLFFADFPRRDCRRNAQILREFVGSGCGQDGDLEGNYFGIYTKVSF